MQAEVGYKKPGKSFIKTKMQVNSRGTKTPINMNFRLILWAKEQFVLDFNKINLDEIKSYWKN